MGIKVRSYNIKLFGVILLMFVALSSCKPDFDPPTVEGVLSMIPDSLKNMALPLVDFLIDEMQTQYSYRIGIGHENDHSMPFHENVSLSRDSLDRLFLDGWSIKVDTVADQSVISNSFMANRILHCLDIRGKYPWNRSMPDSILMQYLLPYKVVHEYPENWWSRLMGEMTPYFQDSLIAFANLEITDTIDFSQPVWLHFYTVVEPRGLPMWWTFNEHGLRITKYPSFTEQLIIPDGDCYLEAINNVRILRSCGLPATIDEIPYWGSKNGSHATDVFWDYTLPGFRTGLERSLYNPEEARRPAKVVRHTFHYTGKYDQEIRPYFSSESFPVPSMANNFWIDATSDHTTTSDVIISIDTNQIWNVHSDPGFIYVLNYGEWMPIHYGRLSGNQLIFHDMGRGNIYRVGLRTEERDSFLTFPFLLDSLGQKIYSRPNGERKVQLSAEKFNHGKKSGVKKGTEYMLHYLSRDGQWINHQTKLCEESGHLVFDQVPSNAFYILRSGDELDYLSRIFLVDETGVQTWY